MYDTTINLIRKSITSISLTFFHFLSLIPFYKERKVEEFLDEICTDVRNKCEEFSSREIVNEKKEMLELLEYKEDECQSVSDDISP